MKDTNDEIREEYSIFETSPNQKSIYAINQLNPSSTSYNITQAIVVNQHLDKNRLNDMTKIVVNKYDSLKTSYHMYNGKLVQKVHKEINFNFEYSIVDSEDKIDLLLEKFVKGYDLSLSGLLRFLLVRVSEDRYYFVIDIHHIIADGISVVMIMHEILDENNNIPHKACKYQHTDVIALKRKELLEHEDRYREYWESKFCSDIPIIDLPFDHCILPVDNNEAGRQVFEVSRDIMENLKNIAKKNNVTLFNLLLTTFYVLLNKLTGQNDLVIGVPISGRNISASRKAIGMFVNTVPFRLNFDDNETFDNLMQGVSDELDQVMKYQDYPMDSLINALNLKRENSRNFLFDVLFSYYSKKFGSKFSNVEKYTYKNSDAQFLFSMNAEEGSDGISIELEYYKNLFEYATITKFGERYLALLDSIIKDDNKKLKEINILPPKEMNTILKTFNSTEKAFDYNRKIYQIIEDMAAKIPNKTAIIFNDKNVSYKQMNEMGNQIAHILVEEGVSEDDCIGLYMDRSDQMLEAILGIWKAGGAYIPIDTSCPVGRIQDIYEASGSKYLISINKFVSEEIKESLNDVKILYLDELDFNSYSNHNLEKSYAYNSMAYIIFTSGSTGKPKGAIIEQVGMTNHMLAKKDILNLNRESVVVQNASQCFDISVWQFFNALIMGGTTLILSKDKVLDINLFLYYLDKNNATVLEVVPSYLSIMLEKMEDGNRLRALEYLLVTGEKVSSDLVKKWFVLKHYIKLVNAYGPTEASDDITHYIMSNDPDVVNIPVGKPIQNMKIYIVDKNENICGIGIKGEIYVAGIGVGRGYIGEEQRTKDTFITNPFNPTEKLYKTGDIGCWLPDGNLEYQERKDYQVKIRGFRIELGEIESKLLDNQDVKQAAVIERIDKNNEKFLCAYILTGHQADIEEIKVELSKKLPYYMIPDHFIRIDFMPITKNGKRDRKKLLEIPIEVKVKIIVKPETWTQKKLALIWCEILNIEKVGIDDKFFELFGHSLKAIQMAELIKEEFNVQFKIEEIFTNDTIRKQEMIIEKSKEVKKQLINKADNQQEFNISPAQNRIFTICQSNEEGIAYNMPGLFEINGNLDKEKAQQVFGQLLERHANLRANFVITDEGIFQKIGKSENFRVNELFLQEFNIQNILEKCVSPFDLKNDLLFRVSIIHIQNQKKLLFFDMHHIISDGVSMGIIVEEFIKLYHGDQLSLTEFEYADFVLLQKEKKGQLKEQERYWIDNFKDGIPEVDLVTDFQRPALASYTGKNQILVIDNEMRNKLKNLAAFMDSTLHMLLMGAYKVLLSKYMGIADLVVGTVSAGRNEPEFKAVIGMFVNTLAIRTLQDQNSSFEIFIKQIKKKMSEALQNDEYQFDDLVENLKLHRDMSRNPIFDTLFVMQDDYIDEIRADGLSLKTIEYPKTTSKFDIELQAYENNNQLILDMSYKDSLFRQETIEKMLYHYKYILEQVISNPQILLKEIKIAKAEELRRIHSFNNIDGNYDIDLSIVDLFEEKVLAHPHNTALIMNGGKMSYEELNNRTNQLAHILEEHGIKSQSRVAIIMDDCFEMIESILAVLKLGAVYVPIDPNFPKSRIQLMIMDSMAKLLLYTEEKDGQYAEIVKQLNVGECGLTNHKAENNLMRVKGEEIACIVYTSGTTGVPKGNLVLHKNIVRVVYNTNYVEFNSEDAVLQTAHYGFDGSFFNIFGALINGAKLVLCSRKNLLDLDYISNLFTSQKISIFFATTSLFNVWVDSIGTALKNIRCVVFGGEKASEKHCRQALAYMEGGQLINGYGPTESTVFTTAYIMKEKKDISENIPIGKVITNTKVYILGINNQINPIGIPGELCIAGHGLVKGYTNAEELMSRKFIINPHNENEILYRTGDSAMWKDDGNIKFLGRIDNQVKINGYRIELEEIETVLCQHENIKDIAVLIKDSESGIKAITAYFTSNKELSGKKIKNWMKQMVPQYMIPKYFIKLDIMPLNQNGKIDRTVLSEIKTDEDPEAFTASDGALTYIQQILLSACETVLGVSNLNIGEDFYERGGDSIKAIQLSAALKKNNLLVSTKDILLNPVMLDLSGLIRYEKNIKTYEKVVGQVKLLPVYQFFIERNENLNYFNQSVLLYTKENVEIKMMSKVFGLLVTTHDMLRAVYHNNTLSCKDVDDNTLMEIKEYDYSGVKDFEEKIKQKIYDIKSSTDLSMGPIFKTALFKVQEGTHILISIHHFSVDTVSWRILLDDLMSIYTMLKQSKTDIKLIKTNSFKDWGDCIYQYVHSDKFIAEKEYWNKIESKVCCFVQGEEKAVACSIGKSKRVLKELNQILTDNLLFHANKAYNTEVRHLLIAALGMAIKEEFNVTGMVRILLEGHGREDIFDNMDVSRTVGWFTTLFPVILKIDNNTISDQIKSVKDNINSIPNNGIGYGIGKYLDNNLSEQKEISWEEISFNYLGAFNTIEESQDFSMSPIQNEYDQGDQISMIAKLEITAAIYAGRMKLEINYNTQQFLENKINQFVEIYSKCIQKVSDYCINRAETEMTLSDFDDKNLSNDDLMAITELLS